GGVVEGEALGLMDGHGVGQRDMLGCVVGGKEYVSVSGEMGHGDLTVGEHAGDLPAVAVADPQAVVGDEAAVVAQRHDLIASTDGLFRRGGEPAGGNITGSGAGGLDAACEPVNGGAVSGGDDQRVTRRSCVLP